MTLRIDMHSMALEVSGQEIATARFAQHAATDGERARGSSPIGLGGCSRETKQSQP
jgi:hypothetical protein